MTEGKMGLELGNFEEKAKAAVRLFWGNRAAAVQKQLELGRVDQGQRGAVTAGKNMDGFVALMIEIITLNGLPEATIQQKKRVITLPGFFRPTKQWDLLVINKGHLVAVLELKSQAGSFGNNQNNRTEEVIGAATDFWTAFREGAFGMSSRPFLGWLMLVEDTAESRQPVKFKSPHYPVFEEFQGASYLDRYNILCRKMIQENLYTSASLIASQRDAVESGDYCEFSEFTGLRSFVTSFAGHIAAEAARSGA